MSEHPDITPVQWTRASTVLGHEERGFSAWLSENLWLVEEALGLDGLALVDREVRVETFRADMVLTADDGTDEGLPVVVENQYGRTNHDHLGKLITYLASWQRGLGVWVVEEATDAHVAAVDFLNRTGNGETGYALLVVRFAPAPQGRYYVDADVLARPNEWVQPATPTSPGRGTPERAAFLQAVHERVDEPLRAAGWAWTRSSTAKPHIRLRLPREHPLERSFATLRASPTEFAFRFNVIVGSLEASVRAVALLKERYGDRLAEAMPEGTEIRWHSGADRANAANDRITVAHPDGGYRDLDSGDAADWAVSVCGSWVRVQAEDPPYGLLDQARRETDEYEPDDLQNA